MILNLVMNIGNILIFRHYKTGTLIVNISSYGDLYGDLIHEVNTMYLLFSFTVTHDRYGLNKDTKYSDIFKNGLQEYIDKKLHLFIDLYMSELP